MVHQMIEAHFGTTNLSKEGASTPCERGGTRLAEGNRADGAGGSASRSMRRNLQAGPRTRQDYEFEKVRHT